MNAPTHRIRRTLRALVLMASVAAIAVPAAAAGNTQVDDYFRDTSAVSSNTQVDDYFRDPSAVSSNTQLDDWFRDPAIQAVKTPSTNIQGDYMFRDFLRNAHKQAAVPAPQSEPSSSGGVDWGTVGVGISAVLGGLLLLTILGLGARQVRHGHRLGNA